MHKLYEKTCDALKDLEHSDRVNIMDNADRRIISELVDLKKNILKVEKLEDEMDDGYSEKRHYVRGHYSRMGDDGMSMARKRDSMGRYSRAHDEMMDHLERAYAAAPDDEMRRHTRELMDKIDRA